MELETVFATDVSSIKFGPGVTGEIGFDARALGFGRCLMLTDPNLTNSHAVQRAKKSLEDAGVETVVYDQVRVEPTDRSFEDAIQVASAGCFDGYVGVGGGSTIDTMKAANLYATHPAPFPTYVNAPIGEGRPVPGPLRPMIAVPTTAGTGSETTGVAIFDLVERRVKTGIAHRALRPTLGIIDPHNTRTLPATVAACSGLDVLSHALESFTALPYNRRSAVEHPGRRPTYQGANPISDVWAAQAIQMVSGALLRAVQDPGDDMARAQMLLAAAFAGIGFGNAGVHLPHGMSYPVSGMVRDFRLAGYAVDRPLIPHGLSVILCAPAVFRFTAPVNPERHLEAARLMGCDVTGVRSEEAGDLLADTLIGLIRTLGLPNGLRGVGYGPTDVDALVAGTLPQHRVIQLSPRPAGSVELRSLFLDSMTLW